MHRCATAIYEFYRAGPRSPNSGIRPPGSPLHAPSSVTYTDVPGAEHELWHPHYLHAIKTALDRLKS